MKLSSEAFKHNGPIPSKYTCQGIDISPPLDITDVPAGTKSLALVMDDPDVPERIRKDRLWVHWIIYNMDPKTRHIEENVIEPGILGKNSGGMNRYMGPCPPDKEHRYFFKIYALDTKLSLPEGVSKEQLLNEMDGHILAQAELMGRFEKS